VIPTLKVGYLVPGTIVKRLPHYDAFAVLLTGTEVIALLPDRYANKKSLLGQSVVAAVFRFDEHRMILSQRSPQYYRRILELALAPLISEDKVKVKRAASVENGGFVKISLQSMNGIDPVKESIPYLKDARVYTDSTITLVRHSDDIKQYIANALAPAPAGKITKVIYSGNLREATVRVDPQYYGLFVGKGGVNVATAAKLLDIKIFIKKAD